MGHSYPIVYRKAYLVIITEMYYQVYAMISTEADAFKGMD